MNTSLETSIQCTPQVYWTYDILHSEAPLYIGIFITLALTIEIVFKVILFGRYKKRVLRYFEEEVEKLDKSQEDVFWEYFRKKLK